jgi:hypothetical protein
MDDDKDDKSIIEKTLEAVKDIAVVASEVTHEAMEPEPIKPGDEVVVMPMPATGLMGDPRSSWRDGSWDGRGEPQRVAGCRSGSALRCRTLRTHSRAAGHPGRQLRTVAVRSSGRSKSQGSEASAPGSGSV